MPLYSNIHRKTFLIVGKPKALKCHGNPQRRNQNLRYWNGYQVFEDGSIINPHGKLIKLNKTQKGYLYCSIKVNGKWKIKSHHRLIAEIFHGECPEGLEVNHKDNNRSNNHKDNLEYVTRSQNIQQSYDSGNRDVSGTKNANCKYTEEELGKACELILTGLSVSEVSRRTNIGRMTLVAMKNGKQWKHIGEKYFDSTFRD